jgi:dTDP-4-dehydrorhamnose 3,5-epimerase
VEGLTPRSPSTRPDRSRPHGLRVRRYNVAVALRPSLDTIVGLDLARKDTQTVTPEGARLVDPIDGVFIRRPRTQADERGTLCEIYDERWGFTEAPLTYAYYVTVREGEVKGWSVHLKQDDRLFFASGLARLTLYDGRRNSPTFGRANVVHLGDHDRALVRIPTGVYHAVRNVGDGDVVFVSLPTLPYEHGNPDKYRLPMGTEVIPYEP